MHRSASRLTDRAPTASGDLPVARDADALEKLRRLNAHLLAAPCGPLEGRMVARHKPTHPSAVRAQAAPMSLDEERPPHAALLRHVLEEAPEAFATTPILWFVHDGGSDTARPQAGSHGRVKGCPPALGSRTSAERLPDAIRITPHRSGPRPGSGPRSCAGGPTTPRRAQSRSRSRSNPVHEDLRRRQQGVSNRTLGHPVGGASSGRRETACRPAVHAGPASDCLLF